MGRESQNKIRILPIELFEQQRDWGVRLKNNHDTSSGVWLQLAKKDADVQSVSYDEAIEIALCFEWIDGQKKTHSEQYWLQKFTPRAARSVWSKINKAKALALIKTGKMSPAGLKEIELAKHDGRWIATRKPKISSERWITEIAMRFCSEFKQPKTPKHVQRRF